MIKNLVFLIILLHPDIAYAYLDPGTGSMLLTGLIAALASAGAAITIYWNKLKSFFSGSKKKKEEEKNIKDHDNWSVFLHWIQNCIILLE